MNWLYATSPLTYVLHQFISSYSFKCLIVGKFQATVEEVREPAWLGKTNFVEIRSFWHIFRSFDRMWSFLILALQVCLGRALRILNSLAFTMVIQIIQTLFLIVGNGNYGISWSRFSTASFWCNYSWGCYEHLYYFSCS